MPLILRIQPHSVLIPQLVSNANPFHKDEYAASTSQEFHYQEFHRPRRTKCRPFPLFAACPQNLSPYNPPSPVAVTQLVRRALKPPKKPNIKRSHTSLRAVGSIQWIFHKYTRRLRLSRNQPCPTTVAETLSHIRCFSQ